MCHNNVVYNTTDLLIRAGLEAPITTQLTQDDPSRMSVKYMRHLRLPQQWVSAEAHMLSDAKICSALESAMLLSAMCFGLEASWSTYHSSHLRIDT